MSEHHLTPRCRSRKQLARRRGDERRQLAARSRETVRLCSACHRMIHALLTEKQLERDYDTLEKLASHPEVASFVRWVSRQAPHRRVTVRWSRVRRSGRWG